MKFKKILLSIVVLLGLVIFGTLSVYAQTSTGTTTSFSVFGRNYQNWSTIITFANSRDLRYGTDIRSTSGTVPTGYMGTFSRVFTSSGALVRNDQWVWNNGPAVGMGTYPATTVSPGFYYSQGLTQAFNGNGYTTQTQSPTRTPNVQVRWLNSKVITS